MCSLVMRLFSRGYSKTEIDQLKYQQCFNLLTSVQYLHSACFLDRCDYLIALVTLLDVFMTAHFLILGLNATNGNANDSVSPI